MPASLWPWLAVAAAGALHGLNPLTGWVAAAWRQAPGTTVPRRHVCVPIAAGQAAAVVVVAAGLSAGLALGIEWPGWVPQLLAGVVLLVLAIRHFAHRRRDRSDPATGDVALALCSFVVGMGHGAGSMLAPALASVCASGSPAREITASGSLLLGLAAVAVHVLAMLLTAALMAAGARRVTSARW